ncbi:hypothetical protein ACA910_018115 [Epithemia clementina (nom. ined.)]
MLWDESLLNGELTKAFVNKAKSWLSTNLFSPQNVLRAMDLRGGVLNYGGLEVLHRLETNGKRFCRSTVIPSTASQQRTAKIIQNGDIHFKFKLQKIEGIGENIQFRPLDVIRAAVRAAGLEVHRDW